MEPHCKCSAAGLCFWRKTVVSAEQWQACQAEKPPEPLAKSPCMHLGAVNKDGSLECSVHEKCDLEPQERKIPIAACSDCNHYCPLDAPKDIIREKWQDPLRIYDQNGQPTFGFRNRLRDGAAFLVCGGPSVNDIDIRRLQERGVWSLAVNNVAGWVRTNAFICGDPPSKFHNGIWRDPSIEKFVPQMKRRQRRGKIRKKKGEEFLPDGNVMDCPNVWGFERRSWMSPSDSWFVHPGAPWGNHNKGVKKLGEEKTVATMLMGIRLLQHFGARRIFLLGADFKFDSSRPADKRYAFPQNRDEGAVMSNNRQLKIVAGWLEQLRPVFEKFGFEVYNCNPDSWLGAFDYCPYDDAIAACKGNNFPAEPFDLRNWYDK